MTIKYDELDKLEIEAERLRASLERILLDVKFMVENDTIPYVLDDFIYQQALELMTPEFMKKFNNESDTTECKHEWELSQTVLLSYPAQHQRTCKKCKKYQCRFNTLDGDWFDV